ncbi:MAG: ArpU family phage packaging/lysis transcriptional regulator [Paenibacillus dendritiformis]|uniref:ArpU family phage packaging/lysis transcriptional regulator n=1 Tax=uncultured Paenibacillus sp. TaxID=227322 RepID=UPI0025FD4B53|nr:ArpU family phage packaging/lysis transcriptional regulator [uncultured Paenibacillus sp.]MDU5141079.1 ArpU family phage packaging/lysis transcriptional regulator [Paenibacillus dendritiformis]
MVVTEEKLEWRAVKGVFRNYKQNELYLKTEDLPSVTENYQLVMMVEGTDIQYAPDYQLKRKEAQMYNAAVVRCVNRLTVIERKIIIPSYMEAEYVPPWQIYEPLHVSRTLFYTTKARAIGKLYVLFEIEQLLRK